MYGKFLFSAMEDEKLVKAVAQFPCLYDSRNKNYKDLQTRENVWSEIGTTVGRNANDCKKRWRNIKDTYMKFRKTKYPKKSRWPLIQHLSFLDSVSPARRGRNKKQVDNRKDMEKDNEIAEDEKEGSGGGQGEVERVENKKLSTTDSYVKANKKQRADDTFQFRADDDRNKIHESNSDNDPVLLFFKSMAMTVKTFEPHLIVEAKSRICQIVNEIELKSIQIKEATAKNNASGDSWNKPVSATDATAGDSSTSDAILHHSIFSS